MRLSGPVAVVTAGSPASASLLSSCRSWRLCDHPRPLSTRGQARPLGLEPAGSLGRWNEALGLPLQAPDLNTWSGTTLPLPLMPAQPSGSLPLSLRTGCSLQHHAVPCGAAGLAPSITQKSESVL